MSQNIEKLLEEIYADSKVTPGEIMKLRAAVEQHTAKVLAETGADGVVEAMCKSFDVTAQLLQETLLKVRKDRWSDLGRAVCASMIESHIAPYWQAKPGSAEQRELDRAWTAQVESMIAANQLPDLLNPSLGRLERDRARRECGRCDYVRGGRGRRRRSNAQRWRARRSPAGRHADNRRLARGLVQRCGAFGSRARTAGTRGHARDALGLRYRALHVPRADASALDQFDEQQPERVGDMEARWRELEHLYRRQAGNPDPNRKP